MKTKFAFDPKLIFPLQLSPFEEYFFIDQRRQLPMTENIVWFFRGTVDREALSRALKRTIRYEPLLFSIVKRRWGRYYWTLPDTHLEPVLTFSQSMEPVLKQSGVVPLDYFDLSKGESVRFHLVVGPDGFLLHTAIHHSLTDGVGVVRFLGVWFSFYEKELCRSESKSESELPVPFVPNPTLLTERENFHIEYPAKISLITLCRYIIYETFLWFCRRPFSLTSLFRQKKLSEKKNYSTNNPSQETESLSEITLGCDEACVQSTCPRIYWQTLSVEFYHQYCRRAKSLGTSVNSLLVRDFFIGLANWKKDIAPTSRSRRRFRFLIPVSMRNNHHGQLPMVNMLGYVFLDRFPEECDRSDKFLQKINSDMLYIREWSIGLFFLDGVRFFRRFPLALRFLTARWFCHSTLVFSNTGVLCRNLEQPLWRQAKTISLPGRAELIRIVGAPPVRPNTPVSIGLIGHHEEMVLSYCIDPKVVTKKDLDILMKYCLKEIEKTAKE